VYGGGAAGKLRVVKKGLDGGGVFNFFGQDEIDAYADDGGGFARFIKKLFGHNWETE